MSSRVLGIVQWQTANGDSHQWICTARTLRRIVVGSVLLWAIVALAAFFWRGHQERMARLQLDEEWRENQILRDRHALLFERVYDLATQVQSQVARLGMSDGVSLRSETESVCWAAQYALDQEASRVGVTASEAPHSLSCGGLALGIRHAQPEPAELRAAM